MDLNTLMGLGLTLYCFCVVAAHRFAWLEKMSVTMGLLIGVIAIPVILFAIGRVDNSSHGNGYYGLDLMMMILTPFVMFASVVFGFTCLGLRKLGRRYRLRHDADGASPT